jgi:sulfate transport system permease protein
MLTGPLSLKHDSPLGRSDSMTEPLWVRWLLTVTSVVFLVLFLVLPILSVFMKAFEKGMPFFIQSVFASETLKALTLSLETAVAVVFFNTIFGLAAAWAVAKFRFPGKNILVTLIDIPFTVSPVIAGMLFVLLFGMNGWLGPWLAAHHIKIIFAKPAIILVTLFVTFPFVARTLIPLMQTQGSEQEEAALTLGASPWQIFFRVTLPNIKWGLLYGIVLCYARALGEFGAVSVVSGHIRGLTNTMPLHVEILYNEYDFTGAFAAATLLMFLALVTLIIKTLLEWEIKREFAADDDKKGLAREY